LGSCPTLSIIRRVYKTLSILGGCSYKLKVIAIPVVSYSNVLCLDVCSRNLPLTNESLSFSAGYSKAINEKQIGTCVGPISLLFLLPDYPHNEFYVTL